MKLRSERRSEERVERIKAVTAIIVLINSFLALVLSIIAIAKVLLK